MQHQTPRRTPNFERAVRTKSGLRDPPKTELNKRISRQLRKQLRIDPFHPIFDRIFRLGCLPVLSASIKSAPGGQSGRPISVVGAVRHPKRSSSWQRHVKTSPAAAAFGETVIMNPSLSGPDSHFPARGSYLTSCAACARTYRSKLDQRLQSGRP